MTKNTTTVVLAVLIALVLVLLRNGTSREHGFTRGALVFAVLAFLWYAMSVDYP